MSFAIVAGTRTTGTWSTGATNITLPSGIIAGELLLAVIGIRGTNPLSNFTASSGWNKIGERVQGAGTTAIFYKTAVGSDTLSVTVGTGSPAGGNSITFRITNGGVPTGTSFGAASVAPNPPLHTIAAAADTLWIAALAGYGTSVLWSATAGPSGYGNFTTMAQTVQSGTTGNMCIATADLSVNAISQDPGTFTLSNISGPHTVWTIAVPYAGGAGPLGRPTVRVGGAWVKKPAKVRIAGAWVEKPVKVREGGVWKTLT